jgi:hypothetical protein
MWKLFEIFRLVRNRTLSEREQLMLEQKVARQQAELSDDPLIKKAFERLVDDYRVKIDELSSDMD